MHSDTSSIEYDGIMSIALVLAMLIAAPILFATEARSIRVDVVLRGQMRRTAARPRGWGPRHRGNEARIFGRPSGQDRHGYAQDRACPRDSIIDFPLPVRLTLQYDQT